MHRGADRARGGGAADDLPARQPRQLRAGLPATTRTGTTAPTTGCTTTWAATRRSPPTASPTPSWASAAATHDAFAAAFPDAHLAFLDACGLYRRVGGYLFVHAGIRPGVPLEAQDPRRPDLDPRAVPELDRRLRLQGRARPHHRAGGRAPPEPDRHRHRGGADGRALLPRARGRRRRAARAGSAAEAAAAGVGDRAAGGTSGSGAEARDPLASPRRPTYLRSAHAGP